ncbi:hypothetical protein CY34DRAFT_391481 [Suillus luteus UH-Slu-Lm8-n1]|uniref:Uncharacterized protein n=1 Tax=Suillus luteus UH-Slu-Lm8-n1 TaxID=930992 RepID=A0A0D0BA59_9AGAM|nr:hypothetical protein CY34DRAFT_391481 [Suillus luteus UH-Slu-Lm8-n1]
MHSEGQKRALRRGIEPVNVSTRYSYDCPGHSQMLLADPTRRALPEWRGYDSPYRQSTAIVDTGMAFVVTKPENAMKHYEDIKGAKASDDIWTVPCDIIGNYAPTL